MWYPVLIEYLCFKVLPVTQVLCLPLSNPPFQFLPLLHPLPLLTAGPQAGNIGTLPAAGISCSTVCTDGGCQQTCTQCVAGKCTLIQPSVNPKGKNVKLLNLHKLILSFILTPNF